MIVKLDMDGSEICRTDVISVHMQDINVNTVH